MTVSAGDQTFEQLGTLDTDLETLDTSITDLLNDGDVLAEDSDWKGPDATTWKEHWSDTVRPNLNEVLQDLRDLKKLALDSANAITEAGGGEAH